MARSVLCGKVVVVCAVVVVMSGWVGSAGVFADATSEIEQAKANIVSLLSGGDVAGADAVLEGLLALADSEAKGQAVQEIGAAYKGAKQYSKAILLAEYVLEKWAGADFAVWAQMEIALCRIEVSDETAAQAAVDKLSADYANDANLPWTLYLVGEHYRWRGEYEKAKEIYGKIVAGHSGSSFAAKAQLAAARAEVLELIGKRDFGFAEGSAEKMVVDFGSHADVAESLYQIAQAYVWQRQYEQAGRLYKMVTEKYPDSAYAAKAQGCLTKTGQVRNIIFGLIEAGNYAQVRSEVDKLIAEFGDETDVPAILYHVASRLEEAGADADARYVYEQIVWRYPGDTQGENAKLDVRRTKVLSFYSMGDEAGAKAELDKLIVDFNEHSHLPTAVILTAEGVYRKGWDLSDEEARPCVEKTLEILDVVINRLGPSDEIPNACCLAGHCAREIGDYEKSSMYCQQVIDKYRYYHMAWRALLTVARNYENLQKTGVLSRSEALPKIKAAYMQLLKDHPDCPAADIANRWLSRHDSK